MAVEMTLDQLQVIISAQTADFKREIAQINNQLDSVGKTTGEQTSFMGSAFEKVGSAATKALKYGAVGAIAAVAASIPAAVKRIDTLVAFPRVLEAMGASSEEAAKATKTLSDRLTGLPTPLQEGAAGVQALVAAGLEVEGATDVFLAFNNATLAASTEAGAAQGAFTQLVQSISKGKIEGQEWNSIVSAMPTAFQALSKESGLTREELRELYSTDPQKLLDDLVKLDKVGGGGLASLEEQARAATGGIGTSFDNMKNSITRGIQGIVRSIGDGGTDQEKLESGQRKISAAISATGKAFGDALSFIGEFIEMLIRTGRTVGDFTKENKGLTEFFVGLFGALALFAGLAKITAITTAFGVALKAAIFMSPASIAAISGLPSILGTVAIAMSGVTATFLAAGGGFAGLQAIIVAGAAAMQKAALGAFSSIMAHPLILTLTGVVAGLTFVIGGLVSAFQQVDSATLVSQAYANALRDAQDKLRDAIAGVQQAELNLKDARLAEADAQIAYTLAIRDQEQATKDLATATANTGLSFDTLKQQVESGVLSYQTMTAEQRLVYDAGLLLESSNARVEASQGKVSAATDITTEAGRKLKEERGREIEQAIAVEAANLVMQGQYKNTTDAIEDLKKKGFEYTDENGKNIKISEGDVRRHADTAKESADKTVKSFRDAKSGADQGFFGPMGVSLSKAGGWFRDMANEAGTQFGKLSKDADRSAGDTKSSIQNKLGNLGPEARGWGGNISSGLSGGIEGGRGGIMATVSNIAASISATFRKAMDINSPSGVFKKYGINIDEGLAQGVLSGMGTVSGAVSKLTNSLYLDTPQFGLAGLNHSISTPQISSGRLGLEGRPIHLTVNVDGEARLDQIINGLNNKSFMTNTSVLNI